MMHLAIVLSLFAQETPYSEVHKLFAQHCASCHGAKDQKGDLSLESFQGVMKGGETGPVIVAGKPAESLLLQQIEHKTKPFMPPAKKGRKLTEAETGVVRAWIIAGAPGPKPGEVLPRIVVAPKIEPKVAPRKAIQSIAYDPKARLIAIARAGEIEIRSADHRGVVRTLTGHAGNVNALAFTADGMVLAAAGGEAGVSGEARLWNVADGALLKTFKGHEDAIYAIALAPDGRTFATGSYDHEILIWDKGQDAPIRTLHGHNEAVFSVAFRLDGKILASVSADRTVKLWDVATGHRRDTLTESTKSLHTVAFSPDGKFVAAGGVDNRIRIWEVSAEAKEGTNPIRHSAFAHEGAILRLAYSVDGKTILSSADDKTVKLWKASDMTPRVVLETQSDWPTALAFALDGKAVVVGRLDGRFAIYDAATGKAMPPPKPEVSRVEPRALARGATAKVKVFGKNLGGVNALTVTHPKVQGRIEDGTSDSLTVSLVLPGDLAPGEFDLAFAGPGGDGGRVKLFVESLPLVLETEGTVTTAPIPASFWGALTARGDADTFAFAGTKGQTLVVDAAARRLGSKAELVVTLTDAAGSVVASSLEFEGEVDPLIVATLPADGKYTVSVRDLQLGASADHFYRLAVGSLPVVTGVYPLAVPANAESEVRLVGANLPPGAMVTVKAGAAGEMAVPVDLERFRVRRDLKVLVSGVPESVESEPNDRPEQAVAMAAPGGGNGRINAPGDADLFRFETKAGRPWVVETQAAQRGSPVDTRIEILHADGRPVDRVLLRAVRDSYITFRPVDPNGNGARLWQWEEMDLGQYLYMQGEIVRLFLAPRGPDSQWDFFTMGGRRRCYLDTSAVAHALDEPAYIVEAHPPGTTLPPNGLPVFPLVYANDDDGDRRLGTDSKIQFTAPADGTYLVRVSDMRGSGSIRHAYRLVVRESKPDFSVTLEGANPSLPAGSGLAFTVRVNRVDGFDGAVSVEITGVPPGFSASTPIVIEAGHLDAKGTLFAEAGAPKPEKSALKVIAKAVLGGQEVVRDVSTLSTLSVAAQPRTVVWLEPESAAGDVLTVKPGGMVSAKLRIQRHGHNERVTFDVENLPFGVIVDDIGLNGILIPEGATERKIFLTCAAWVAETTRPCYARIREGTNPTSKPLILRVPGR